MKRISLPYLLIVLTAAALLLGTYQQPRGLWSSHEARAGQIATNMLDNGEYVVQRLHTGLPSYQKPPLYYWGICLFAKVLGEVDHLAIRLPTMASALVLVVVVFIAGSAHASARVGLVSALVLLTMMRFWWQAHLARIDMMLAAAVVTAGLAFYSGYTTRSPGGRTCWYLVGYVMTAFGVLAKGPLAVVLTASGIGLYILVNRDWAELRDLLVAWVLLVGAIVIGCWLGWTVALIGGAGVGIVVALALYRGRGKGHLLGAAALALVALPYFIIVHGRTDGAFTTHFFIHHNVVRFTGQSIGEHSQFKDRPFWLYLPQIIVGTLPWTWFAVGALVAAIRRQRPFNSFRLFLLLWAAAQFIGLSLSSFKRADYMASVYPLLALLIGCFVIAAYRDRRKNDAKQAVRATTIGFAVIGALMCVICAIAATGPTLSTAMQDFAASESFGRYFNERDAHNLVTTFRILETRIPVAGLVGFCAVLAVGVILAWKLGRSWAVALGSITVLMATCLMSYSVAIAPHREPQLSHIAFAKEIRPIVGEERLVIYCTEAHQILLYLKRKSAAETFPHAFPQRDAKAVFQSRSDEPVFFVMKEKCYRRIEEHLPPEVEVVARTVDHHFEPHLLVRRPGGEGLN
ncbi:MAG: hypothetical protein CMJ18_09975 [Phycisphaeraceae bacterium]|nr:hypothetical protein [Phycisphaeraceae bacterium]